MPDFSPHAAYGLAALAWATLGAIWDIRTLRIPNWLTGSGLLLGLLLHFFLEGCNSAAGALLGAMIAGGVFLMFYVAGGMNAGDVKLIAAVCCLAGLQAVAPVLIGTALLGGIFALALAVRRSRALDTPGNVGRVVAQHGTSGLGPHPHRNVSHARMLRLPYGVAILGGTASWLCGVLLR